MKRLILSASLFCLTSTIVHSQISKGTVLLGGGISVTSIKEKDTNGKNSIVNITPAVGVAIKENLIVGVSFIYNHSNQSTGGPGIKYNNYGGSFFVRKYLALGKGFFVFGEGDLFGQRGKYTIPQTVGDYIQKTFTTGLGIYPGLSYAITKKFFLEIGMPQLASFSFTNTKTTQPSTPDMETNAVAFNVSASGLSSINVGFRVLLPK
jgi:hypothetical protein